jgi:hypothetical protein
MTSLEPTMAELWATSQESSVSEEEYYRRWEMVRLLREAAERRSISREEVATWLPRPPHVITLEELLDASWRVPTELPMLPQQGSSTATVPLEPTPS